MEGSLNSLIDQQRAALFYYSPYNFLGALSPEKQWQVFIKEKILRYEHIQNHFINEVNTESGLVVFLYEYLPWDSDFLNQPCYKLFTVLYAESSVADMVTAINTFKNDLAGSNQVYLFIDIPAEDIFLIQCLTKAGFLLVETRLHLFKNDIQDYQEERFPVKKARPVDAEKVARIAGTNRNAFDRLHADVNFPNKQADEYLRVYAQAAVNGFCDTVLIPAEVGLPVDSFLAISHLTEDSERLNTLLARIVLAAVGPANKGWHKKLVSEAVYYAKERNAAYVLMTTQATNRAVFRTCEKLNFKLGGTSHILAFHS